MKFLLTTFLFLTPGLAQLSITGTVTNSKTGEPIQRAAITLQRYGPIADENSDLLPAKDGEMFQRKVLSDAGGRFRFTDLSPGTYGVLTTKPEFVFDAQTSPDTLNTIRLSSSLSDLSVQMSPLGVITGTITDQDGLPLPGVNVIALTPHILDGIRRIQSAGTVPTDDRGIYRMWNLAPGEYYIKAANPGGSVEYAGGDTPISGDESFAPVYFGGSRTQDSAAPIELGPGGEGRADFSLQMQSGYHVTGSLSGFVSGTPSKFELFTGENDVSAIRASTNLNVGKFAIGPVVPGSYLLRATQGTAIAETWVTVENADTQGVSIALLPPVNIPVSISFTNAPPPNPDFPVIFSGVYANDCRPQLRSLTGTPNGNLQPRQPPGGGQLAIVGVPPGKYNVIIDCNSSWPVSATLGAQDLGSNPTVTIAPGTNPGPLQIVATYGGGSVKGTIKGVTPPPDAVVILAPQFATAQNIRMCGISLDPENPANHAFTCWHLAPGTYTAWLLESPDVEYRNPEFLRKLTGGTLIRIDGDGETEATIEAVAK